MINFTSGFPEIDIGVSSSDVTSIVNSEIES